MSGAVSLPTMTPTHELGAQWQRLCAFLDAALDVRRPEPLQPAHLHERKAPLLGKAAHHADFDAKQLGGLLSRKQVAITR